MAAAAGALIGTGGIATEWAWTWLVSPLPWQPALLPRLPDAVLAAVGGALCAAAGAAVLGGRPAPSHRLVALGGAVLALAVLLPLPRTGGEAKAVIRTFPAGSARPAVDRFGRPGDVQPVTLEVTLRPDVGAGADWAVAMAWQGGGREVVPLRPAGGGTYRSERPIDTGSGWKTMVYVARGAELLAAPVSFPSDLEYGTPGVPLVTERSVPMTAAPELLMAEAHPAQSWVASASEAALAITVAGWLALLVWAYSRACVRPPPVRPAPQRPATA